VGTGLLAVPVLAGSAGYAVAEAFGWSEGLGKRLSQARGFYGVIIVATVIGLVVNFTPIGAITMLYYSAMLNGVLAPPLMVLILLIGNNKKILGERTNSTLSNTLGIIITVLMSIVSLSLLYSLL
jgi:Mn2+/Fe2+ NRAMP family transporter